MNKIFETIMHWWRVDERIFPQAVDVIVAISYGATPTALTNGGIESLKTAAEIYRKNSNENTVVAWGVFTPTSASEIMFREKALEAFGIKAENQSYIGPVASTIEEALKIKEVLAGRLHKTIVVVAGAGHSRRAQLVWRKEFSESNIQIVSFVWRQEIQKDHPMLALRNRWAWISLNMALYLIFLTPFGYAYFRKNCKTMRQVTAK